MPIPLVTENPYRLARDIRGIGFKTRRPDRGRLGIAKTAMIRARAGITYALAEAMDDGHCGLPEDELRDARRRAARGRARVVDAALALELADGSVVADTVDERAVRVPAAAAPCRARDRRAPAATGRQADRHGPRSTRTRPSPGSSASSASALAPSQREAVRWRCARSCW